MTHKPIPLHIYRIGDLKDTFARIQAQNTLQFGRPSHSADMTMGNSVGLSLKASLDVLDTMNEKDFIILPDAPAELTTALSPHITKPLHAYFAADQTRVMSEAMAQYFLPLQMSPVTPS